MRAEKLTPNKDAHQYNQAIMDLGATLCTRTKPRCNECPFKKDCQGFLNNQPTFYPVKIPKKTRPVKQTRMLIIKNKNDEFLLVKRPATGIWGGLWSFPECNLENDYYLFTDNEDTVKLNYCDDLEKITHQFTHFILEIFPIIMSLPNHDVLKFDNTKMHWYTLSEKLPGGIATPVSKILTQLAKMNVNSNTTS